MKAQPANDNGAPRRAQVIDLAQARAARLPSRVLECELIHGLVELHRAATDLLSAAGVWHTHPTSCDALLRAAEHSALLLRESVSRRVL